MASPHHAAGLGQHQGFGARSQELHVQHAPPLRAVSSLKAIASYRRLQVHPGLLLVQNHLNLLTKRLAPHDTASALLQRMAHLSFSWISRPLQLECLSCIRADCFLLISTDRGTLQYRGDAAPMNGWHAECDVSRVAQGCHVFKFWTFTRQQVELQSPPLPLLPQASPW